ncbi:MAG: succinate dehydrogenase assembly factor 2 [Rhodovibrionaceae bacterium]
MAETADALEKRRKKLAFRSWHRGTREMDLLIGGFAAAHLSAFDSAELDAFEELLRQNDLDLYAWLAGRRAPPPEFESPVLDLFLNFKYSA